MSGLNRSSLVAGWFLGACVAPTDPPNPFTPSSGGNLDTPSVSVWGDVALVQSADAYGQISAYALPSFTPLGAWTDIGRVRWVGPTEGPDRGVLVSSFDGLLYAREPGWLGWMAEPPTSTNSAADAARWSLEGERGDAFRYGIVWDVDGDGASEALLWGFPYDEGGTVAALVPLDAQGSTTTDDHERLTSALPQRHALFDGDGDGNVELYRTTPLEPVGLPLTTLEGSGEALYPATAMVLPDLTGDGLADVLLQDDSEFVLLPGGAFGTPYDELSARLRFDGCDLRTPYLSSLGIASTDIDGDGARELVVNCGDFDSVRVVAGPIEGETSLADVPTIPIPEGLWGPDSFYDIDGDGAMDLLIGRNEEAAMTHGSPVAVVSGTDLLPR